MARYVNSDFTRLNSINQPASNIQKTLGYKLKDILKNTLKAL